MPAAVYKSPITSLRLTDDETEKLDAIAARAARLPVPATRAAVIHEALKIGLAELAKRLEKAA